MMCIFNIDFVLLKYQASYMWSKSMLLLFDHSFLIASALSNIWESPRWLHFIIASKQWISFHYSLYFILEKKIKNKKPAHSFLDMLGVQLWKYGPCQPWTLYFVYDHDVSERWVQG